MYPATPVQHLAALANHSFMGTFIRMMVLAMISLTVASAQAQDSDPKDPQWFVVNTDTASMRGGDSDIYYTIAEYTKGTILAVDGTSGQYSMIRYPAELGAFVPARDAQTTKAGSHIRLTKKSALSASSMLRGLAGSWSPVYQKPLAVDTEMMVLETIQDDNNTVQGYLVAPPRPPVVESYPYGYILTSSLRAATSEEIKRHQGGKQITTGRPALRPGAGFEASQTRQQVSEQAREAVNEIVDQSVNETASEPAADSQTLNGALDAIENTQDQADSEVLDLREQMIIPEVATSSDAGAENQNVEMVSDSEPQPAVIENAVPVVRTPVRVEPDKSSGRVLNSRISASSLESLEASFTSARSMSRADLDEALPELLAEFTRTRESISEESEAAAIDQRIEWIKIRIQTRDQRRAIAQALATADTQSIALGQKMELWNTTQVYSMVGRLMLSAVYTGDNLPLLYRIQSPDPITGRERTVGYIAPMKDGDLRRYLGRIVGVVGRPVRDDALAMSVLTPTRVDLMPGQ
ncbi:MAG: hypothetical protein AB8C13_09825 [Phycisphaerales bacterium]